MVRALEIQAGSPPLVASLLTDKATTVALKEIAQEIAVKHLENKGDSPFEGLSEREFQVLLMTTAGRSSQEIAEQLFISPKTVNTYRYRLFEKLGVDNDVGLTHLAIRYGVIQSEEI